MPSRMGIITRSQKNPSRSLSTPSLQVHASSNSRFVEKIEDTNCELTKKALTTPSRVPHWRKVLKERYVICAQKLFTSQLEVEWVDRGRDLTKPQTTFVLDDNSLTKKVKVVQSKVQVFWIKTPDWGEDTRTKRNKLLTITIYNDIKSPPSLLVQGYSTPTWVVNELERLIQLVDALSQGQEVSTSCGSQLSVLSGEDDEEDDTCITFNLLPPLLMIG